jgi:tripartite-type tricarboxylate transporter receptor subunit TctC
MTRWFVAQCVILAIAGALVGASPASSQDYPSKPIRIIVPTQPGGMSDIVSRLFGQMLTERTGATVVVENKTGANGALAADYVAKSAPDGYTIYLGFQGTQSVLQHLDPKLPYDPAKDFAPIVMVGTAPLVWVAPKSAFNGSVADYLKAVKAAGDKSNYGSIGAGSGSHLAMELIKEKLGLQAVHVPFAGGPQILNGILGGEIQITLLPGSTVAPQVQSGKMAAIAVTSAERSPLEPNLPSMNEIGAKGVNIEVWNAIMAPAKMPAAHQAKLNAEIAKILTTKEVKDKLAQLGWKVEDTSVKFLSDRIRSDTALYGALITAKGYKLD